MNIQLIMSEEDFDKSIGDLIKARLKTVLRNDTFVRSIVNEVIEREVAKMVQAKAIQLSIGDIKDEILKRAKIDTGSLSAVIREELRIAMRTLLKPNEDELERVNRDRIGSLFAKEIKAMSKKKPAPKKRLPKKK